MIKNLNLLIKINKYDILKIKINFKNSKINKQKFNYKFKKLKN